MTFQHNKKKYICSLEYTMSFIGGKWKILILWHLAKDGVLRYGELRKKLKGISHKVYADQLKELERDKLILRKEYAQIPPKVEYKISDVGLTLIPLLEMIDAWGMEHFDSHVCK